MDMPTIRTNAHTFRVERDTIDVTSIHRPDTSWRFTDAQGHEHRWYTNGQPAESYSPAAHYDTPTLVWVKDGEFMYEDDDEPTETGHMECVQCGEHVTPRSTADTHQQFIAGLTHFYIDEQSVSKDEFERLFKEQSDQH